jgi:anti-sigma regulatory factor (Ser/Thr protein kinase)
MTAVELELPGRSAYVGVARLVLGALGRAAGLDEDRVDDLKIAASEACANAVYRHDEVGVEAPVTVRWVEHGDRIEVQIADRGGSLDPAELQGEGEPYSRFKMSLALLRGLVDDCEIRPQEAGGMCTVLVLWRAS